MIFEHFLGRIPGDERVWRYFFVHDGAGRDRGILPNSCAGDKRAFHTDPRPFLDDDRRDPRFEDILEMGIRVDMGDNGHLARQGNIIPDEDILGIGIIDAAVLADIDILADMDSPSPVHLDPPGIQRAEKRQPIQDDVADLPADELELAHLPALAGVLDRLGQVGSVVEVRNLNRGRYGDIILVGHA